MFRGATTLSLDSKGRLAIPAKYRQALSLDCEGKMVCTIDIKQPCLLLYPLPEWQIIEQKLTRLSSMNPAERRLQRLLLGHADDCEMDKNGRLLISAPLRQHAGLEKKLMLVGQLNKFELWDEDAWHDQVAQDMDVEREGDFTLNERLEDFSL
ncbi:MULTISPECIES: division/cell wall cluster transcriptional repressor MraZ [Idiomarina]|jgi:MraZ protein|uniref:Transcriptional regulator MraZ n=2 Tax=Idiomarina TaxID=135575 RepID=A0A837NII1_9GAMM|nr:MULTISPECIES: division/cell wall cluster transcriptional repressor MraZ [Idiomarina]KTG28537.1 division/cell wall cluster transcriptional repressor MraZ [Idiomarina sp. H105]MBF39397.1 transcriptional regulator MraZ [Idiomarinaceae bacterium]OAF08065.1 division/cell wall cluster transcriptional repressor MraZ [Idiomarina sp. WRN-38]KPD24205.1 cell division protein MraZ [Idiomarina zobellii]MCH2454155.1 division/cell wall cluster transcriptional repressor MraZ [Idiomarina sp.]|tara:strand:- start:1155 stop:1613 length:459 start_codon:yes stop_codon:yes gene_type:complete